MAIQSQPSRIPEPFAGSGTKNTIPATNTTPSASQAASWASGFPPECSQPISAGGCPVPRDDVNGALNQLSQDFAFRQDGGIWEWSALADYDTERVVRGSDGLLYCAIAQSGPSIVAGAQDPTLDTSHTYWVPPKVPTMPADDSSSATACTAWVVQWNAGNFVPENLYVDAVNGDDSNDGKTLSSAKKTIAAAVSIVNDRTKLVPALVHINIASGTYTENVVGTVRTTIDYAFSSGANLNGDITCGEQSSIRISGTLSIKGHILANTFGLILITNNAKITWDNYSGSYAIGVYTSAVVRTYSGTSQTYSFTNCSFSNATVVALEFGMLDFSGAETWSGTVTGKRYNAYRFGLMSGFGSTTAVPGTVAGTTDSLSIYI